MTNIYYTNDHGPKIKSIFKTTKIPAQWFNIKYNIKSYNNNNNFAKKIKCKTKLKSSLKEAINKSIHFFVSLNSFIFYLLLLLFHMKNYQLMSMNNNYEIIYNNKAMFYCVWLSMVGFLGGYSFIVMVTNDGNKITLTLSTNVFANQNCKLLLYPFHSSKSSVEEKIQELLIEVNICDVLIECLLV